MLSSQNRDGFSKYDNTEKAQRKETDKFDYTKI